MNKKFFIYFTFLLLFLQVIYAEDVLKITLLIDKSDNVILKELRIRYDPVYTATIFPGGYRVQILDSYGNSIINESLDVLFCVLSDPPVCSDWGGVSLAFDFSEDMKVFKLFHKEVEIFQSEINLCNNNGVCDSVFETFFSCPQDCRLGYNDELCIAEKNSVCDPDCGRWDVDSDCEGEFYPDVGQDKKETFVNEEVFFHGEVINPYNDTYSFSWLFDDDWSTETGQNVSHVFKETGVYVATLRVMNKDGIYKENILWVTVLESDHEEEFYPDTSPEQPEQQKKESIIDKILALWGKIMSLFKK